MFKSRSASFYYNPDASDSDGGYNPDVEAVITKKAGGGGERKGRRSSRASRAVRLLCRRLRHHPCYICLVSATTAICILLLILIYTHLLSMGTYFNFDNSATPEFEYPYSGLQNLVIVAGHAVFISKDCEKKTAQESSWYLEGFQKHPGQAQSFLKHIKAGIDETAGDDKALLLFSGGETRKPAGPRSEAQSYWTVADKSDWFRREKDVKWRTLTEEHARDSFENLLFSICRFRELTGQYPQNITVISYDIKEPRFTGLHRGALRFPASRFFFIGTTPPVSFAAIAMKSEEIVQELFRKDPYGCAGSLHLKRLNRDPFHRAIPYPSGCPELRGLFTYCGSDIYPGKLPWDP